MIKDESMDIRVLLAEDQCSIRNALVAILSSLGVSDIVTAANGAELVRQARMTSPDVILSDVNMPELDGPDALDHFPNTPCILISGRPFPDAWCSANTDRLIACIRKPFRTNDVEAAIRAVHASLK